MTSAITFDCLSCGACCAFFRVSFYWGETSAHPEGTVPEHLTDQISSQHVAMKGTQLTPVRCVAPNGQIGKNVSCSIYEQRSSTCRAFISGTEACIKARQAHGL